MKCWVFFLFIYRLQAEKEGDKGDFSPEALCDMPCSVPSTPNQPHVGNKTKTSFTIKWTVSLFKYFLFLFDTYMKVLIWNDFHKLWSCSNSHKELLLLLKIIVMSQLRPWFLTVSVWAEMHDSTHNTILLDPLSMENERHHSN